MAAERIGCDSQNCYVFEDSLQGLDAGMAAGATVIGLTTNNPVEKLKDKAHALIDSFVGFSIDKMLAIKK